MDAVLVEVAIKWQEAAFVADDLEGESSGRGSQVEVLNAFAASHFIFGQEDETAGLLKVAEIDRLRLLRTIRRVTHLIGLQANTRYRCKRFIRTDVPRVLRVAERQLINKAVYPEEELRHLVLIRGDVEPHHVLKSSSVAIHCGEILDHEVNNDMTVISCQQFAHSHRYGFV